jgi:hypothetical protein
MWKMSGSHCIDEFAASFTSRIYLFLTPGTHSRCRNLKGSEGLVSLCPEPSFFMAKPFKFQIVMQGRPWNTSFGRQSQNRDFLLRSFH